MGFKVQASYSGFNYCVSGCFEGMLGEYIASCEGYAWARPERKSKRSGTVMVLGSLYDDRMESKYKTLA